jgi:hypothetical protein
MKSNISQTNNNAKAHGGARPMKTFIDGQGTEWLCDAHVNPNQDFTSQGCWRTDMMAFNRND